MNKHTILQADIIPLTRSKNNLDFFTYAVPETITSLQPGHIVTIPFRNKSIRGLVFAVEKRSLPKYTLKEIESVVTELPVLSKWQMSLVKFISEYYLVSMATIAHSFAPDIPKKIHTVDTNLFKSIPPKEPLHTPFEYLKKSSLCLYRKDETKFSFLKHCITTTPSDKQCVIIFPDVFSLQQFLPYIADISEHVTYFSHPLPKNEYWDKWQSIKAGKKVIIGTRSALFAPFDAVDSIIVVDEEHPSHKQQEPNPRYQVHTLCDFLSEQLKSKTLYLSRAPRIETLHKVTEKKLGYHKLDSTADDPVVRTIDMRHEKHAKHFSFLGREVIEAIEQTNGKVICIHDKKGYATGFMCGDCKSTIFQGENCPECGGHNLLAIGKGIQFIKKDLSEMYPHKKVEALSSETDMNDEEISQYIADNDIIVGTQYILPYVNWDEVSVACVLSADISLSQFAFNAVERLYTLLYGIRQRLSSVSTLFVQTKYFEHPVFSYIQNGSLKDIYVYEIKQRKALSYPPFAHLIRIFYKLGPDENETVEKMQKDISKYISTPQVEFNPLLQDWYSDVFMENLPDTSLLPLRALPIVIDVDAQ